MRCAAEPDSAVLPGVAISTAIMPPICIIGIGVAFGRLDVAWGAFLLFSANIIAIIFASIVIFNLYGFKNRQGNQSEEGALSHRVGRSIVYPVVLLVLVSIPLTLFMVNSVQDNQTRNTVRNTIEDNINKIVPGGEIVTLTSQKASGKYVVDVVIRSTKPFTSENIRGIENELEYKLTLPVVVNADIVLVQQISDSYAVSGYEDLIKALTSSIRRVLLRGAPPRKWESSPAPGSEGRWPVRHTQSTVVGARRPSECWTRDPA